MAKQKPRTIFIEERAVCLPSTHGNPDVFTYPNFYFIKTKWQPDESCTECLICKSTFTPLRRKHHCRNCGQIFCNKCCSSKIPLPQLALDEPQRVCNKCRNPTVLVSNSRSQFASIRQEAIIGMVDILKNRGDIAQLVESGGLHTLISLTSQGDNSTKEAIARGIHYLAQYASLHSILIDSGAVKAIFNVLSLSTITEEAKTECLGALRLMCSSLETTYAVLECSVIGVIEEFLLETGTISLLASSLLYRFVENCQMHDYVLKNSCSIIANVWKQLLSNDIEMEIMCMRVLIRLSVGIDKVKIRILKEDDKIGQYLLKYLRNNANAESKALRLAICLIANLATIKTNDQNSLQAYLGPLLNLLDNFEVLSEETVCDLSRALGNFAEYPVNSLLFLGKLPAVLNKLFNYPNESVRARASIIVCRILLTEPDSTIDILRGVGAELFIQRIYFIPGMSDLIINHLNTKVFKISTGEKKC